MKDTGRLRLELSCGFMNPKAAYRKKAGFFLLETVIGVSLLLLFLPVMYGTFVAIETHFFKAHSWAQKKTELAYIESVCRKDLKSARQIVSLGPNNLELTTVSGQTIRYRLNEKGLMHQQGQGVFYLNKSILILAFLPQFQASRGIAVTLRTDVGDVDWRVMLVNLNEG